VVFAVAPAPRRGGKKSLEAQAAGPEPRSDRGPFRPGKSLEARIALVTGAAHGIGRGIAERLGRDGAWVVVNYVEDRPAAQDVVRTVRAAGGKAIAVRADVAKKSAVNKMFARVVARWGGVDILVNNAGICPFVEFLDITEDVWDRVHAVNLKGSFLCSQAAARIMVEKGIAGRIISISSVNAHVGGPLQAHYTPTKAGQVSLMQSLAVALGRYGITCNSVLPGSVRTNINAQLLDDPDVARANREWIPLGRVGDPRDVAGVVAFLAGDDASYVSGAEVLVDGASFARRERDFGGVVSHPEDHGVRSHLDARNRGMTAIARNSFSHGG
jgi:L-rhamnose 1-dehydrogenase